MSKKFRITKRVNIGGKTRLLTTELDVELTYKGHHTDYETGNRLAPEDSPCFSVCGMLKCGQIEMGGQCLDNMAGWMRVNGFRSNLFNRVLPLWKKWHLNDLTAGSKRQEAAVEKWRNEGHAYDYDSACKMLKANRLLFDKKCLVGDEEYRKPYQYGHAWMYRPIPKDDLAEINAVLAMGEFDLVRDGE